MAHVTSVHYAISNPFIYTIIFYFIKSVAYLNRVGNGSCNFCTLRLFKSQQSTQLFK